MFVLSVSSGSSKHSKTQKLCGYHPWVLLSSRDLTLEALMKQSNSCSVNYYTKTILEKSFIYKLTICCVIQDFQKCIIRRLSIFKQFNPWPNHCSYQFLIQYLLYPKWWLCLFIHISIYFTHILTLPYCSFISLIHSFILS